MASSAARREALMSQSRGIGHLLALALGRVAVVERVHQVGVPGVIADGPEAAAAAVALVRVAPRRQLAHVVLVHEAREAAQLAPGPVQLAGAEGDAPPRLPDLGLQLV